MKLIDKYALVAEINRVLNSYDPNEITSGRYALVSLRDFIDTLEVKEVDLERETDDYINEHFSECEDGVLISDANSTELTLLDVTSMARHFFELGLSASNPITAADRGTAEEIIINLKRVEQDYRINLAREMEWLRNQVKKGEEV